MLICVSNIWATNKESYKLRTHFWIASAAPDRHRHLSDHPPLNVYVVVEWPHPVITQYVVALSFQILAFLLRLPISHDF